MNSGLLLLACALAPAARQPTLVRYALVEQTKTLTPAGERASVLEGTVHVAGADARWDLAPGSSFPRAKATSVIAGKGEITLLDARQAIAAHAPLEELSAVFAAPGGGDASGAASAPRDTAISVARDGAGAPFQGLPTARYRVTANVVSTVTTPGRVATVRSVYRGTLEVLEGADDAASPFDDLARLFPFRGEARESLAEHLSSVSGFPVRFVLDGESEASYEGVGGAAPPDGSQRPPRTTVHVSRTVSSFERRPLRETDRALFAAPEEYRTRGVEVLLDAPRAVR